MAKKFLTGIDMDGNKISNVPSPTQEGDIANYQFVISQVNQAKEGLSQSISNLLSNSDPSAIDSFTEVVQAFQQADTQISATIETIYSIELSNAGRISTLESSFSTLNGTSGVSGTSGTSGTSGIFGSSGTSGGAASIGGSLTDLIQFQVISEGSTVSDGFKGFRYIDSDMTIEKVNLFSNGTASISITVKIEDAIIGTMSLADQKSAEDSILAGWTTNLVKGTYIEFYVNVPGGTSNKIPATIVFSIEVTKII